MMLSNLYIIIVEKNLSILLFLKDFMHFDNFRIN
jgi:hypothetical protein